MDKPKDIVEILVEKGADRIDAESANAENEGKGDEQGKVKMLPPLT